MFGKRSFHNLYSRHVVPVTFLLAYLAVSGAVDPVDPVVAPKPPTLTSNSSATRDTNTDPRHPAAAEGGDMVEQLPYFFILQLPNLMSDEPTWAEWSQWSPCGASCGPPSKRVRRRKCQGAIESACKGDPVQWRVCKTSPCPQEKTSQSSAASEVKTTTKVTVPADVRKWEREKMERIEAEYQRIGATYAKKPEAAEQLYGISADEVRVWEPCRPPCPYKVQLRRRWCYLGQYCVGAAREMRVCGSVTGGTGTCGSVNTTDLLEPSDMMNHSSPWPDARLGWSIWTPWVTCSSECGYFVQTVNWSTPCVSSAGLTLPSCHGLYELVRVCREQAGPYSTPIIVCGQVENFEHWTMVDDTAVKHRYFFPSSNRLIHGIIIFVLFAPPVILLFYWLLSRARKPRYESLPSASPAGDSAVDANGHPTISADVTSALGPNHLTLETDPEAWKTI